jgi:hypothetical protein
MNFNFATVDNICSRSPVRILRKCKLRAESLDERASRLPNRYFHDSIRLLDARARSIGAGVWAADLNLGKGRSRKTNRSGTRVHLNDRWQQPVTNRAILNLAC